MNRGSDSEQGENALGSNLAPGLSIEAIQIQLERISASQGFIHSDRMTRFLRFAVEQSLQGRADQLKESVIGMEVFDRTSSFDPRTDTIVRVEARRLRAKLKDYYESEGRDDIVLIDFPKGSYVPTFLARQKENHEELQARLQPATPSERSSSATSVAQKSHRRVDVGTAVAVGGVLLAAGIGITLWLTRSPETIRLPTLTRLTSDTGLTYQPALSPDGKLVAYASDRSGEGNLDIWLKHVSGGEPRRLTNHQADDHEPAFSHDGAKIAFRSERDGGGIYEISTISGNERLIASQGRHPRFSPDGQQIAFKSRIQGSGIVEGKIYVVASAGGSPRQLQPEFAYADRPIWSPDGRHLLFAG
jgi:hypothetical protein